MLLQIVAAIIVFVATHYFFFWISGGLLLPILGSHGASVFPMSLTISLSAAAVASFYVWKRLGAKRKERNPPSQSVKPEHEVNLTSAVVLGAILAGSIGFIGGFFGPLLLMPGANQGPLLGIFITGPVGILLGPPLGIAMKMRHIKAGQLRMASLWLILSLLIACGFYAFSTPRFLFGAEIAILVMTFVFFVGCALLKRGVSVSNTKGITVAYGTIFLLGAGAIIFISAMPPVMRPWWGPQGSHNLQAIPSHAFIMDAAFDASRHIPKLTVDLDRWQLYILLIALTVIIASLVVMLADRILSKGKHF
ncbi:MAG: hypothetical protein Q7V00_13285 [Sulfurimicrobium sp.]|nr:hypothetical protein [Sulfurimicrobium sp.]MDP2198484.1 hypothetical protein [Sulfurimicrobium sp.]